MGKSDSVSFNKTPPPISHSNENSGSSASSRASSLPSAIRLRPGAQAVPPAGSTIGAASNNAGNSLTQAMDRRRASLTPDSREKRKERMGKGAQSSKNIAEAAMKKMVNKTVKKGIEGLVSEIDSLKIAIAKTNEELTQRVEDVSRGHSQIIEDQRKKEDELKAVVDEKIEHSLNEFKIITQSKIAILTEIIKNTESHILSQLEASKAELVATAREMQDNLAAQEEEIQARLGSLQEKPKVEEEREKNSLEELKDRVAAVEKAASGETAQLRKRVVELVAQVDSLKTKEKEKEKEETQNTDKFYERLLVIVEELKEENKCLKEQLEELNGRLPPHTVEDITPGKPPAPRQQVPLSANQRLSRAVGRSNWFCKGLFWGLSIFTAGIFYLASVGIFWAFSIGKED